MNKTMNKLLAHYNHNKSDLARMLDVSPQAVNQWFDSGYVPANMALKIEKLTDGKYKAIDLCKSSL